MEYTQTCYYSGGTESELTLLMPEAIILTSSLNKDTKGQVKWIMFQKHLLLEYIQNRYRKLELL